MGRCTCADPILDTSEVTFGATMGRSLRQSVMSNAGRRTQLLTRGSWPFLGLLVVLAFLGHDALMAAPSPALAAERPSLARTLEAPETHAWNPLAHGCEIGRAAALKTQDVTLRQSTTTVVIGHPVLLRPAGLPSYAAPTQARSPTAQRAVLQVFRI
jgi:hypothetical protein